MTNKILPLIISLTLVPAVASAEIVKTGTSKDRTHYIDTSDIHLNDNGLVFFWQRIVLKKPHSGIKRVDMYRVGDCDSGKNATLESYSYNARNQEIVHIEEDPQNLNWVPAHKETLDAACAAVE